MIDISDDEMPVMPFRQEAPAKPKAAPKKSAPAVPHGRLYPAETGSRGAAPDRVPPSSAEAEEQLLSACLLDGGEAVQKCIDGGITGGIEGGWCSFYVPANRVIFGHLVKMLNEGKAIDLAVLAEELKTTKQLDELGGYAYLTRISGRIPTTAQLGYFIEKVRELEVLREGIRIFTGGVEDSYGYSGDLQGHLQKQEAKLQALIASTQGKQRFLDRSAADFFNYPSRDKARILLGHEGALKRGGALEWVAPTGQGKTSSVTDACMEWCRGRAFMGLASQAPLKILIIQAEDDEEAMGKIMASFCARHKLSDADKALIAKNLIISQVKGVIGPEFIRVLEQKCKLHRPDIVVINPVNRYVHGSMTDDKVALEFTAAIDGVNIRLGDNIGYICVSHTGKPPKGEDRSVKKEHWEMAYMSIGSSAWANYYRTTVYLEPRKKAGHYWLVLGKNYKSWGLRREYLMGDGEKVIEAITRIPMRHSEMEMLVDGHSRPMIVWEPDEEYQEDDAEQGGGSQKTGRKSNWSDEEVVSYFPSGKESGGERIGIIARRALEGCGVKEQAFFRKREQFLKNGWVKENGGFYFRTENGDHYASLKHQPEL